jgi:hypothetical protein
MNAFLLAVMKDQRTVQLGNSVQKEQPASLRAYQAVGLDNPLKSIVKSKVEQAGLVEFEELRQRRGPISQSFL